MVNSAARPARVLPSARLMLLAPRHLGRLAATVGLFTRYGLRGFARQQGLAQLAPDTAAEDDAESDVAQRADAFRTRLIDLGPAYIKLGQVLSTRPDLLPAPYIEALEQLQDDVAPVPAEEIEEVIQQELGGRVGKLFATFDREPLGSASLGQVHAAELRDGRAVVVKVQRPGIRAVLADDIEFFRELAGFLASHTPAGDRVDMVGIVQQLERALVDELDYRVEARNGAMLRRSLAEFPHILVPRVVEGYSTERVLTTERVRGVKISSISPLARLEYDFRPLADDFAKGYLKQITIDGHFHADPHPGNVFVVLPREENPRTPGEVVAGERRTVTRPALTPLTQLEHEARREASPPAAPGAPKLALIDFGMTARLSTAMREHIVTLLLDISENRGDEAAERLIEMGDPIEDFDRPGFVREVAALVSRSYDQSIGEIDAGALLFEMTNVAYRRGLRLPAELTLLAKTLFNLDAVTRALDPTYSPIGAVREYSNNLMNERARRELSPQRLFQAITQTSNLLNALPHRLDIITQRMAANETGIHIEMPQLAHLLQGMQKIANRIFVGLVLCGLCIASAMLLPYQRRLGTVGFVIAAVLGVYMVVTILITDRTTKT